MFPLRGGSAGRTTLGPDPTGGGVSAAQLLGIKAASSSWSVRGLSNATERLSSEESYNTVCTWGSG